MSLNNMSQKRLSELAFCRSTFSGCEDIKEETCLVLRFLHHQLQRGKDDFVINDSGRIFLYFASGFNTEKEVAKKICH